MITFTEHLLHARYHRSTSHLFLITSLEVETIITSILQRRKCGGGGICPKNTQLLSTITRIQSLAVKRCQIELCICTELCKIGQYMSGYPGIKAVEMVTTHCSFILVYYYMCAVHNVCIPEWSWSIYIYITHPTPETYFW